MTLPPRSDRVEGSQQEQWGRVEMSESRCVELSLPARPELWSLVRMAVGSVASIVGYDLEETDDLRLALDELCNICAVGATSSSTLHLTCHWSPQGLYVDCSVFPIDSGSEADGSAIAGAEDEALPAGLSQQELSMSILSALVDAHGVTSVQGGTRRAWLRKTIEV